MKCDVCGEKLSLFATTCPGCGAKITADHQENNHDFEEGNLSHIDSAEGHECEEPTEAQKVIKKAVNDALAGVNNPEFDNLKDKIFGTDEKPASVNIEAIICYISFLPLIILFGKKGDDFVRFHAGQGAAIFVLEVISGVLEMVGESAGLVAEVFEIAGSLLSAACIGLSILGIVNVINGRKKELPVIGRLFKNKNEE